MKICKSNRKEVISECFNMWAEGGNCTTSDNNPSWPKKEIMDCDIIREGVVVAKCYHSHYNFERKLNSSPQVDSILQWYQVECPIQPDPLRGCPAQPFITVLWSFGGTPFDSWVGRKYLHTLFFKKNLEEELLLIERSEGYAALNTHFC
jgi:hypothetical protein